MIVSILIAIVDLPNFSAASLINFGFLTAAELIDTLSAPDLKISEISATFLIPPPTVSGIKIFSAVFVIIFFKEFLLYRLATTS